MPNDPNTRPTSSKRVAAPPPAPPAIGDPFTIAVNALRAAVGEIGTDAIALERPGARKYLDTLLGAESQRLNPLPDEVAIIDSPSGFSERRPIAILGTWVAPTKFDEATRLELAGHMNTVLDQELPLILHRWAFDQIADARLSEMELSAAWVISVQRSLLVVRGNLMVRVGKVVSDPRAQMVSLREQTVLNPDQDDLSRVSLPRPVGHPLFKRKG